MGKTSKACLIKANLIRVFHQELCQDDLMKNAVDKICRGFYVCLSSRLDYIFIRKIL